MKPSTRKNSGKTQSSQNQPVSKKVNKQTKSPDSLKQKSRLTLNSLDNQRQLDGKQDQYSSLSGGQKVFTEIWPSSYCESPPYATKRSVGSERLKVSSGTQGDSVLAQYIERFRHGQPQSREERQQTTFTSGKEQVPYWWMSHSADSTEATNTITDKDDFIYNPIGDRQHYKTLNGEFDDKDLQQLEERTNKLLLRGERSPSDGSLPVSSDGLGCSNFSSPVSLDEPVRQPVIPSLIGSFAGKDSFSFNHVSSLIQTPDLKGRPEDDILFQWRLRRKMEQARERPPTLQDSAFHGSAFVWQTPSLNHPPTSQQLSKFPQNLAAPQTETTQMVQALPTSVPSGCSEAHVIAHVPPHTHLLCDVLPCPVQSSRAVDEKQTPPLCIESQPAAVHKESQVCNNPSTGTDGVFRDCQPISSHVCATTKRKEPGLVMTPEKTQKKKTGVKEPVKMMPVTPKKQRKLSRGSSDQVLAKKTRKKTPNLENVQEPARKRCNSECEQAPSPVHIAMQKVVSDVLFSAVDSNPAPKSPVSSVPPPSTVSSQSAVSPCDVQNSLEVISKLLRETEDSDENEFADDPVLQVLRQKRKLVKHQISEVESLLNEQQQIT